MKNKKAICHAAIFLVLVIVINKLLNFMLIQPGLARTIFYESSKGGYDVIALGASHGTYGVDADELSDTMGGKAINMCMGGEYFYDSYYVLKYALKNNKPKTVILDIDYQYLVNEHDESILFNQIYNAYPNCFDKFGYFLTKMMKEEFRGALLKWTNYWQCYYMIGTTIERKLSDEYKTADPSLVSMNPYDTYMGNGFIYRSEDCKKSTTGGLKWEENKVDKNQCKYIKKIVDLCKKNNINIVFTTVAIDPTSISKDIENYQQAHDYLANMADKYGVSYYDFNLLSYDVFNRTTDDFYDEEGHMYGKTAKFFTNIYGNVIKSAVDGTLNESDYFKGAYNEVYG